MGVGLHYASKYQVTWEGGYFDYDQRSIYNIFTDYDVYIDDPSDHAGEDSESYQIARSDLWNLYHRLEEEKPQKLEGIPLKDFLYFLEKAIKNSDQVDNWVHFYWF